MTDQPALVAVGRIVKVFGIRGEVVVKPMSASHDRFERLKTVFVGHSAADARTHKVAGVRIGDRGVRLALEGVSDRTAAEQMNGMYLFVPPEERIKPAPGSFFVEDIVGLHVRDETGRDIGTVGEVLHMPAHDVYLIRAQDREILLPAVKEFVIGIDVEKGEMTVRLIDGMMDEE
jgi:16S rRNA processing protein RimM